MPIAMSIFEGPLAMHFTAKETLSADVEIAPIVEQVQRDMLDSWRQDDQLLDNFFPIGSKPDPRYQRVRKGLFNKSNGRWKGISVTPNPLSRLYTPLVTLMNRILFHYGISRDNRLFLDTHIRRRGAPNSTDVSLGIFLAGVGTEFATSLEVQPAAFYELGISAVEVLLEPGDFIAARDRLAVHMHNFFQSQTNRRFAFGLIMTQHTFTVYMFDHSGAVSSSQCNYHDHPDRFCAVISGLASEAGRMGFDDSIFCKEGRPKIYTIQPNGVSMAETCYIIKEGLFHFPSLVGRGTVCWLTSRRSDQAEFVIKDAWIAPAELAGRESEGALLQHACDRGVVTGVAQIHHFEEVRRSSNVTDLDTVLHNRQAGDISPTDSKVERVHTRIVLATHGKTLDNFSTRKELLFAFHDAVLAHRNLHDVAGVLHRDISVRNILINPHGDEGNRGILIDFDHSIRVGDTSPYSTKTKIGTWRYMSRVVLKEVAPHSYLDDLESFYYVLCWILGSFERPGVLKAKLPAYLNLWDSPRSGEFKIGQFVGEFEIPISPWFGKSLCGLAAGLHDFFKFHRDSPDSPTSDSGSDTSIESDFVARVRSPLDPTRDYDKFLSIIRQCISTFEQDAMTLDDEAASDSLEHIYLHRIESESTKRKRSLTHEGNTPPPTFKPPRSPTPLVSPPRVRPRRSNVDYGLPPPTKKRRSQKSRFR